MNKTVRIYGLAANINNAPPVPSDGSTEVWASNYYRPYYSKLPRFRDTQEWTRWFNLHSREYMLKAYPNGYDWYKQWDKPVYLRHAYPDIPNSRKFPRDAIQDYFGGPQVGSPGRFFTFTGSWLIGLCIAAKDGCIEGFEDIKDLKRIEFWGFRLANKPAKPHECYKFERPGFWYWVDRARKCGIEVTYQKEIEDLPFEPGDPATYDGPLYGYGTNAPYEE